MKIVIADDLPRSAVALLAEQHGWTVDATPGRPLPELLAAVADADALVVRSATKVTSEVIAAAPRLRVIARAGTGVDNVDLVAASARGIIVMNAPGANSISVAELAMGQLLALARHLPAADAAMKAHKWEKKKFAGGELRGKTLGIVGLGRIGQEVAARARAFEMQIVAHDPFISEELAAQVGARLGTLDEVFAAADYLTLHLPVTPQTRHVVNAERLAKAKKGIRIINTARGELIDDAALAAALDSGQVGGAALDVFQQEPPTDWSLAERPTVVASPHIAASTGEAQELVGVETAAAVRDYLRDGIIRNAVNFPSLSADDFRRLQPWIVLAERLGSLVAQMGEARTTGVGVRYYGELADGPQRRAVERGAGRAVQAHPVGRRHGRQREGRGHRAGHRSGRVAQFARPQLHQPAVRETAHQRRRALGGRHDLRARRATPGAGRWRAGRSAPVGNADRDPEQRSARRHRRRGNGAGPAPREHRELRPRTWARRRAGRGVG